MPVSRGKSRCWLTDSGCPLLSQPYVSERFLNLAPQPLWLGQVTSLERFVNEISGQLGQFLPRLIWAIVLLLAGWVVATLVALAVKRFFAKFA